MSPKERDRLKIVDKYVSQEPSAKHLTQAKAAQLLRISRRQFQRLVVRYKAHRDDGLVHRARGQSSNRKLDSAVAAEVVRILNDPKCAGFAPTYAADILARDHGIVLSRETVRQLMIRAELWKPKPRKVVAHSWRARRDCFGELVQMDTSIHDWFEGRGEQAVLILMIDDATSRVLMRFYSTDSTLTNMDLIRRYLRRNGRPLALYTDRASHFKTSRSATQEEQLAGREAETQIQRALRELDIEYIAARSPQAKGRVERAFGTTQDRLVKDLRLADISTIDEANEYLEREFIPWWNGHLSQPPAQPTDAHRRIAGYDLNIILSRQTTRTVANDYTIQHNGRRYQIARKSITAGLKRAKVTVEERLDGTLLIRFRGRSLRYGLIDALTARAGELRSPGGLRSPARPAKAQRVPVTPKPDHPWRGRQKATVLLCTEGDISTLR